MAGESVEPTSILIVDDQRENRLAFQAILDRPDYRLVTANSGEEALRRLLEGDFAVLILDVRMPGMDGFELARTIKSLPRAREVPILFVTAGHDDPGKLREAYVLGAADFIAKPVEAEVLRAKVAVFVLLHRQARELERNALELKRREVEEERRANERHLRSLVDAIPTIVWTANQAGEITAWNRTMYTYTGLTPEECRGQGWFAAVHPDDHKAAWARWQEAIAKGQEIRNEIRVRRASDGAWRWHVCRGLPERNERGELVGWIGTATDVEDLKELERSQHDLLESEQKARAAAERANRTKDEFLATVSHELRTPLTAITGWVRLLQEKDLSPERRVYGLEVIARNALAQARLIDDLLDLSRVAVGKLEIRKRPIELSEPILAAVDTVRPAADTKKLVMNVDVPESVGQVSADRARVQQIVWNLLNNAVKFTPEGGRIEIRARGEREAVVVEVADTGIGISKQFLPTAFEPFRQEDQGTTRRHGGLGLGLAIVKQLIDLHGASIAVESELGRGTLFRITFPKEAAPRSGRETPAPIAPARAALGGLRLLVVEDDRDSRDVFIRQLRGLGAEVTAVGGVQAALEELGRAVPDVMLSDLAMPNSDGFALIRAVRALRSDAARVRAIAVSAFVKPADRERALAAGFDEHVPKPVSLERLVLAIQALMARGDTSSQATH